MSTCVTGSGNKMYFGSGTRLTVESKNDTEPAYYKVGDETDKVCLATGFSKFKATNKIDGLFDKPEPTMVFDEKMYSQVAFLNGTADEEKCSELEAESGVCERSLEPDPTVNSLSLTILGLRLIFIKTVIFNILMTFKLWISQ
ncbi:M1-specific T cell receptor alpha chain-like [Halichoeres trimaculatus]|uniref:M1-specific T cell receptor alpha chain-like n=1 Tax=Halichoeres trimaculatus TaxID=147232 RepID=UPI003D9E6D3C